MKVLVIDNFDSFVYNLVQYIGQLGGKPEVYRNTKIDLKKAKKIKPDRILISPGPGNPEDSKYFGVSSEILLNLSPKVPTLGVCLGHQGVFSTFGGKIVLANKLMHGKTSWILHNGKDLFYGVENPLKATRYHSLAGDKSTIPTCLEVTAETIEDKEIMGVRHINYPIEGIQFHPESILTTCGKQIIKNFLDGY
jgi:anthranilate synthase component 2